MSKDNPRFGGQALALSDVFLTPVNGSTVLPDEVNLTTKLTKNIVGKIPFLSSAMDTVTESEMAIAVARAGGVGVIHRNLSIDAQAEEVRRVKRSQSGMISDPITVTPEMLLGDVEILSARFHNSGFPVVDSSGKLVGLITNRDTRLQSVSAKVADVMTPLTELQVSGPKTTLEQALKFFTKSKKEKLPLVDRTGKVVGFYTWKDVAKKETYPNACLDNR